MKNDNEELTKYTSSAIAPSACTHSFITNNHNIGTCTKCGEVRQFPWERGQTVLVLTKGNNSTSQVLEEEEPMTRTKNRRRRYANHKEAIIADLLTLGRSATRARWNIPSPSLYSLESRWLTPEQKAAIPSGNQPLRQANAITPDSAQSHNRLPPFPPFSDTWHPQVQLEWLHIYGRLADKQPHA
jgi:hypothetical protein